MVEKFYHEYHPVDGLDVSSIGSFIEKTEEVAEGVAAICCICKKKNAKLCDFSDKDGNRYCNDCAKLHMIRCADTYLWPKKECLLTEDVGWMPANKVHKYTCAISGREFASYRTSEHMVMGKKSPVSMEANPEEYGFIKCGYCRGFWKEDEGFELSRDLKLNYPTCNSCLEDGHGFPVYYNGKPKHVGVGRTIGIEIECEPTVRSQIDILHWIDSKTREHMATAEEDNSLRGKQKVEYTSPILSESTYEEWLHEMCSRLKANVYNRCGLHIHLGSNDLSWLDLARIGMYCKVYEPFFSTLVSPSRHPALMTDGSGRPLVLPRSFLILPTTKREFLIRLYGTYPVYDYTNHVRVILNRRANDQNGPRYTGCIHRYLWVNFQSHFYRRTVEIRLHQGTVNETKIRNWIRLWLQIISAVQRGDMRHPYKIVSEDLKCYYTHRAEALAEIGGAKRIKVAKKQVDIADVLRGFRNNNPAEIPW